MGEEQLQVWEAHREMREAQLVVQGQFRLVDLVNMGRMGGGVGRADQGCIRDDLPENSPIALCGSSHSCQQSKQSSARRLLLLSIAAPHEASRG